MHNVVKMRRTVSVLHHTELSENMILWACLNRALTSVLSDIINIDFKVERGQYAQHTNAQFRQDHVK